LSDPLSKNSKHRVKKSIYATSEIPYPREIRRIAVNRVVSLS
jgi:hypothetical protein